MYFRKVVMLNLFASLTMSQEQLGSDIDGEAAEDISGYDVSLDSDGDRVAIGAFLNDGNGSDAGQHQYTWQPQELATGTYFLRLITANQTFTQKVTYVK